MTRRLLRRFAWLMLGAAIGLATALLVVSLLAVVAPGLPREVVVLVTVLAGAGLGLVPGARELEVTAARTMLDADAELVVPRRPRWAHRRQTMAWVVLHQLAGVLVGVGLFAAVPAAGLVLVETVTGRAGTVVDVPAAPAARAALAAAAVVVGLAGLAACWPVGAVAARWAGRFLGPTASDRLELATSRAAREAEHTRLARELHDGIGHALTIVSVQAAAGRRVGGQDPAAAAAAFATIEDTARDALAELDELLAVLREDRPGAVAPVDLAGVVETHRRAGLVVDARLDLPAGLPPLLQRTVQRITAEALTNAHRHGTGPVRLVVSAGAGVLTVEVSNPRGGRTSRRGGGRGLAGVRERVALFGGTVEAGPEGEHWVLRATLPLPERSDRA
ncbi:two-component sensor histidine kinase [Auraticoccus sp. F435]|uniref:histidine kinase n=1 Tax=Auraticoccus cholistanensis TaxID=2656650 RepID=A0A6A9URC4_9ACTN|nr:histidine kinase [Auraticoccus cholistanensis]MVA75128.1 two-component sensor histidine kinase [Auraticoccus cholistanensis]